MSADIIKFRNSNDPGRRNIRVDTLLDAVQHYAFIDVDRDLVGRLMDAAKDALLCQSLWVEINAGDCRRLRDIDFSELDAIIVADLEGRQ